MLRRRISPLFAVFVAFVVLMASNAWLKGIFGYGEIATDIPFLLAGAVLFLAWRFNRRAANQRSDLLGSARFGYRADVRKLEANGDLLIGRSAKSGKLLHYDGAAHLLTMAPTRSGKGVGTIIPNLLLLDRSVICIDPKGENARVTARARAAKGKVWCLDPFGVSWNSYPPSKRTTVRSELLRWLAARRLKRQARNRIAPASRNGMSVAISP